MKEFNVGDKVKITSIKDRDADAMGVFAGLEGIVSSIYPSKNAPFPIYVTFDEQNVGIPFARDEVVAV